MRIFFPLTTLLMFSFSCVQKPVVPEISKDHKWIMDKSKSWQDFKYKAANSIAQDEKRKETLTSLKSYLADTLNYFIKNVRVNVDEIKVVDMKEISAFYAEFSDVDHNQYFMEFDYPIEKKDSMKINPAYKLLINIPEKQDTVLSFFYMGEADWDGIFDDNFKIRVIPFPKNYNVDSARAVNKK